MYEEFQPFRGYTLSVNEASLFGNITECNCAFGYSGNIRTYFHAHQIFKNTGVMGKPKIIDLP